MDTRLESKADNNYLPVLIIGQAGHGKSTMINYLLRRTMTSIKLHGVNRVDVTDGPSAPTISHKMWYIGTNKRFGDKNEYQLAKKPEDGQPSIPNTIECNFTDKLFRANVIGEEGESITSTTIPKIRLPSDFPKDIETLMQDSKNNLSKLLGYRSGLIDRGDGITSSYISDGIVEVCKTEPSLQFLIEKIRDPDNWILMN